MFDVNVKNLGTLPGIILDPYQFKDLRLLVEGCRQDFINSVLKILDPSSSQRRQYGGLAGKKKANKTIYAELHEKRILLDDLERALEVAANGEWGEIERQEWYISALKDEGTQDDVREEKRLGEVENEGERMTEKELLIDIRKWLAKVYLYIDKVRQQDNRKAEWELTIPQRVNDGFKKYQEENEAELKQRIKGEQEDK